MFEDLLLPMFDDEYYPDILVAEVKQIIKQFAKKIAKTDLSEVEIYRFAAETVCGGRFIFCAATSARHQGGHSVCLIQRLRPDL